MSAEPDGWMAQRTLAADHPSLAGHFPDQPVYPGVVLLAEVLEAALAIPPVAARLGAAPRIDNVKFLAPVLPAGAPVALQLRFTPRAQGVDFELHHGPVLAVRGQLAG